MNRFESYYFFYFSFELFENINNLFFVNITEFVCFNKFRNVYFLFYWPSMVSIFFPLMINVVSLAKRLVSVSGMELIISLM